MFKHKVTGISLIVILFCSSGSNFIDASPPWAVRRIKRSRTTPAVRGHVPSGIAGLRLGQTPAQARRSSRVASGINLTFIQRKWRVWLCGIENKDLLYAYFLNRQIYKIERNQWLNNSNATRSIKSRQSANGSGNPNGNKIIWHGYQYKFMLQKQRIDEKKSKLISIVENPKLVEKARAFAVHDLSPDRLRVLLGQKVKFVRKKKQAKVKKQVNKDEARKSYLEWKARRQKQLK
ncbi:hypothetical protein ACFL35_13775 [Candidatus Riflebacteria bacterium]